MSRRERTGINIFGKSLSQGELKELREKLNSIPYLWSEQIVKSDIVLQDGPLDIDELIAGLRRRRVPGLRHVFNSEVVMTLEYLKGRGVVAEETLDRTERTLDALRVRSAESTHLGPCPAELSEGVESKTLISLYAQKTAQAIDGRKGSVLQRKLVHFGVFCLFCEYHHFKRDCPNEIPLPEQRAPIPRRP